MADDCHGLSSAPAHHRSVIVDQLCELRPDCLFLLIRKSLIDLSIKLASSDPHRIVIAFIKSADEFNILFINAIGVEDTRNFLERCDCFPLNYRVIRACDDLKWSHKMRAVQSFFIRT